MSPYAFRNKVVRDLGFDSYSDYLRSDLWLSIRRRVMARFKGKCQSCGSKATEVHHKHYSPAVLRGEHICGLKAICRKCHDEIERLEDGTKTEMREANRRMRSVGTRNGKMRPLCSSCRCNPTRAGHDICRKCKRESKAIVSSSGQDR